MPEAGVPIARVGTLGKQAANNVAITGGSITGLSALSLASGQALAHNATVSAPAYSFANDSGTGFWRVSGGNIGFAVNGNDRYRFAGQSFVMGSGGALIFTQGSAGSSQDTFLLRDAANTLALRNGLNTQTLNVYGSYTDGSNYERLRIVAIAGSSALIARESAGTGVGGALVLRTTTNAAIVFDTNSTQRWVVNGTGHITAGADNTYDIGSSGSLRPRNIYAAGNVQADGAWLGSSNVQVGASNLLYFSGRSAIRSSTDGLLRVTNFAGTDFTLLQFGGSTVSFPALKRSAATLQVRLADDSADATLQAGRVLADLGTQSAPSFSYVDGNAGMFFPSNGVLSLTANGTAQVRLTNAQLRLASGHLLGWGSGTDPNVGGIDTVLARDAANTLALRNGVNAQTFNVYNTFTDASNYERLRSGFSSNRAQLLVEAAGTGTSRNFDIGTVGASGIIFLTQNTSRWTINASGHFLAGADNAHDIGTSAANRPKDIHAAGSIYIGGSVRLTGAGLGNLQLRTPDGTSFGRLGIGPLTSAFPSLKVSSATLQVRLGDDSAFTKIQGQLQTDANAVAETPAATHTLTLYDAAGTAYKVLCVAA